MLAGLLAGWRDCLEHENSVCSVKFVKHLFFIAAALLAGDAGGAIGAAILCGKEFFTLNKNYYLSAYLGNDLNKIDLGNVIKKKLNDKNLMEQVNNINR